MKTRCTNCNWVGEDDDLSLFETRGDGTETITAEETPEGVVTRHLPEPKEKFFFKGCPNCKTDGHLMDIEQIVRTVKNIDGIVKTFNTDEEFLKYVQLIYKENEDGQPYPSEIHWLPEHIQQAIEYIVEYCPDLELTEN